MRHEYISIIRCHRSGEYLEELRTTILDRLEQGNLDLPLLPQVASQVLTLTSDPNADASKLSSLIQQDQALATQILRIANSPAYMPRSPIVSLQQAIAWLGLSMLAGLAFSVSVQSGVFQIKGYEKEVKGSVAPRACDRTLRKRNRAPDSSQCRKRLSLRPVAFHRKTRPSSYHPGHSKVLREWNASLAACRKHS